SGTDSIVFPVPLVLGSGKSGTPWLRMQLANLIASAIGSPEAGGLVGVVVVESRWGTPPGAEPAPQPAAGSARATAAAIAAILLPLELIVMQSSVLRWGTCARRGGRGGGRRWRR